MLSAALAFGCKSAFGRKRLITLEQWMLATVQDRDSAWKSSVRQIEAQDVSIQAWVEIAPQISPHEGKLSRIPFGVKDIIETRGLKTEYGSPVYKGRMGTFDADIVQEFRTRGAVLFGKTQTAAFATRDPCRSLSVISAALSGLHQP